MVTTTIEQLRELREHRSVRQLADEVGTSAEMIRRWLRGEAQPRADRAETIRQLFVELKGKGKVSEANPFTGGK